MLSRDSEIQTGGGVPHCSCTSQNVQLCLFAVTCLQLLHGPWGTEHRTWRRRRVMQYGLSSWKYARNLYASYGNSLASSWSQSKHRVPWPNSLVYLILTRILSNFLPNLTIQLDIKSQTQQREDQASAVAFLHTTVRVTLFLTKNCLPSPSTQVHTTMPMFSYDLWRACTADGPISESSGGPFLRP